MGSKKSEGTLFVCLIWGNSPAKRVRAPCIPQGGSCSGPQVAPKEINDEIDEV